MAEPCIGRERADLVLAGCAILEALLQDVAVRAPARRRPGPARGHPGDPDGGGRRLPQRAGAAPATSAALQSCQGMAERQAGAASGPAAGSAQLKRAAEDRQRRTASSQRWLERQLNDPYVAAAKREGYRSRAAYKLIEIDDKHRLLKPGARVVDLGAAPGGWTPGRGRARARRSKARARSSPSTSSTWSRYPASSSLQLDFMDRARRGAAQGACCARAAADVVLSDMAAPTTGHTAHRSPAHHGARRGGGRVRLRCAGAGRRLPVQGVAGRHRARAAGSAEAGVCHASSTSSRRRAAPGRPSSMCWRQGFGGSGTAAESADCVGAARLIAPTLPAAFPVRCRC